MLNLTFGEQVKIVLNRKGMTIKELAEKMEEHTGKKMSRQNLTQRLGRDNFQEQDMRVIAEILGTPFCLSILKDSEVQGDANSIGEAQLAKELELARTRKKQGKTIFLTPNEKLAEAMNELSEDAREITIGELTDMPEEVKSEDPYANVITEYIKEPDQVVGELPEQQEQKMARRAVNSVKVINDEDKPKGETNPYTGKEYESNSVRVHPTRFGFVQVYDRADGKWTEMTEWAFLGYQERKKELLGKEYKSPIYLD